MASIIFRKTPGQSSVSITIVFQNKLSIRYKLTTYFLNTLFFRDAKFVCRREDGISIQTETTFS